MQVGTIPLKEKQADVIRIVNTKLFKINYSKLLHSLFIVAYFTKHTALCIRIQPYNISFDFGSLSLGIDFNYRLNDIDHKGFGIILRFLIFEIEIECTDDRHLEDYEQKPRKKLLAGKNYD